MQITTIIPLLSLLIAAGNSLVAAEALGGASEAADATADARAARLSFADGSTLLASVQTPALPLETLFGTADIPFAIIKGAEFFRAAPGEVKPVLAIDFDTNTNPPKISTRHQFVAGRNGKGKALRVFGVDNRIAEIPFNLFRDNEGVIEFWARIPEAGERGLALSGRACPALIELSGAFLPAPSPFGASMLFTNNDGMGRGGLGGLCILPGTFWIAYGSSSFGEHDMAKVFGDGDPAGWHHYAITWSKNGLDLPGDADTADLVGRTRKPLRGNASCAVFVDGRLVAAGVTKEETRPANPATPLALILQKRYAADQRAWIIDYDDIKIWNRAKLDFKKSANETAENTAAAAPKTRARVKLSDGSIINGSATCAALPVETIFGPASIPIEIIKTLNFPPAPQPQKKEEPAVHDKRLVYWNTFNSESETQNPAAGPKSLAYYTKPVPGKFGAALSTEGAPHSLNVFFNDGALASAGTIEFWAKLSADSDILRGDASPRLFTIFSKGGFNFDFTNNDGLGSSGLCLLVGGKSTGSNKTKGQVSRFSDVLGEDWRGWHHYAIVWDDEGIRSDDPVMSGKAFAVLVDGKVDSWLPVSAATKMSHWDGKPTMLQVAAPMWGRHTNVPFAIDEFKIWNYAKVELLAKPQPQKNAPKTSNDPRLIYWNTFESEEATKTPAAGVPTKLNSGKFVAGKHGNALHTQGKTDVAAFTIPPGVFKKQGCIEFWAKLDADTDKLVEGRLPRFLMGAKEDRWSSLILEYRINNGMGAGGFTAATGCIYGTSYFGQTYSYKQALGENYNDWHHYAVVWDDETELDIPDVEERPFGAIFIDGKYKSIQTYPVGAKGKPNLGGFRDYVGNFIIAASLNNSGNTHPIPFAIDDLKIWTYAKMDFAAKPAAVVKAAAPSSVRGRKPVFQHDFNSLKTSPFGDSTEIIPRDDGKALRVKSNGACIGAILWEKFPRDSGTIEFWARIHGTESKAPGAAGGANPALFGITQQPDETAAQSARKRWKFQIAYNINDGWGHGGLLGTELVVGGRRLMTFGTANFGVVDSRRLLTSGGLGGWHHYALVWDAEGKVWEGGPGAALFVDGKKSGAAPATGAHSGYDSGSMLDLILQPQLSDEQESWIIDFDELKIWDYAKIDY